MARGFSLLLHGLVVVEYLVKRIDVGKATGPLVKSLTATCAWKQVN